MLLNLNGITSSKKIYGGNAMNSKDENNMLLHNNLTAIRRQRGVTQYDVAQSLGISDKTYSKWETGENEISVPSLLALAEYYQISPVRFFSSMETSDTEEFVKSKYASCDLPEAANAAFDIQFQSIFQLAQKAFMRVCGRKNQNIRFPIT